MPVLPKTMLELLHAVITSLLLSAAAGCGVGPQVASDEEPDNSETGVEVGTPLSHLASPRGQVSSKTDSGDELSPAALAEHASFCEPTVCLGGPVESATHLPLAVSFPTAGRSP